MKKKKRRENRDIAGKIIKVIKKNQYFFITSHIRPDGDSIGSQLALASLIRRLGKHVFIGNIDRVPSIYAFLPGSKKIHVAPKVNRCFDVSFYLDCSNLKRAGGILDTDRNAGYVVNIDHHVDNGFFGNCNYVDAGISSVSEQVYNLIKKSALGITRDEAVCIYTGILTDTGKFQETNTTSECHAVTVELLKKGVSASDVANRIYRSVPCKEIELLCRVLKTLKLSCKDRIACLKISQDMYKKTGTSSENTEGMVDYAKNIKGVKVGILFREMDSRNQYKVSIRSKGNIDVSKIARMFSGGGHKNAAGFTVRGSFDAARNKVVRTVSGLI